MCWMSSDYSVISESKQILQMTGREFPGGPVVRTPLFHCRGPGSFPGWATKIPQAHGKKKKKKG